MNPNICINCGGEYEYRNGRWVCRACGSYKPEAISTEEESLLYAAFQRLRLADFDEAEKEFNDIVLRYPKNPNGYWGCLMSKYGIKYEQDFDGRMIPTCYATSMESVMNDNCYQRALEYADDDNKNYYRKQAWYIEKVRKEWVEKAKKEPPYDIFICYKDSDLPNGIERTRDSFMAQDLYVHLMKKGYRVFFSRESLRDKVGEKYEPYIFNALATAKVMIVYGSKLEFISSTWMKNEWSRYGKRMQEGEKHPNSLLVACEGFSSSSLPRILSCGQCFDANARSFYSDLDESIDRILRPKKNVSFLQKCKIPLALAFLLLLISATIFFAGYFLSDVTTVLNEAGNALVVSNDQSFPRKTEFYIERINSNDGLKDSIQQLEVNQNKYVLYNMGLRYQGNIVELDGIVTVTIPSPAGMSAEKIVIFDMNGSSPQKIVSRISGYDIIFETDHFGVYMIGEALCEHISVTDPFVAPTCTEDGLTEGSHCSLCNVILIEQTKIPAEHKPGLAADCTNGCYCLICREQLQPAIGHIPGEEATCVMAQSCAVCQAELKPAAGHSPGAEATCMSAQTCTVCQVELAPVTNIHSPGAEATCTSAQTCTVCQVELTPMLDHSPGAEATCMSAQTCTVCQVELTPMLDHSPGAEATCMSAQTCTVCQTELVPALDYHSPGADPTCTSAQTCMVCQIELRPALAHRPGGWVIVTPSTKTENGLREGSCTICGEKISEIIYAGSSGLLYNVTSFDEGICTISGIGSCMDTDIVIPVELDGFKVTGIAQGAFWGCDNINSVVIPDGVIEIEKSAFLSCRNLTSITIPDTVTKIGESVFSGCWSLTDVIIPVGVTSVSESLFSACTSLTSVIVPDTVTSIGKYAFSGCYNLNNIAIPIGVTEIGDEAFNGCGSLTHITIPDAVTKIGRSVFSCCGFENITIPSGVTTIGYHAFYGCSNLTSVIIPEGVTCIEDGVFYECNSLQSIRIPSGVTSIGSDAFYGCTSLTSITLPDTVTDIYARAFMRCSSLIEINIPDNVTLIGSQAFCDCSSWTGNLVIPSGVTSIYQSTFYGCKSLTSVTMHTGITSIGDLAFYGCENLASIIIPDGVTDIGEHTFNGCVGLTNVVLPESITRLGNCAFGSCLSLTSIVIPGGVTDIGQGMFENCQNLINVSLSAGIKCIGNSMFDGCNSLVSITIPDGVTSIGDRAFFNCWSLTSITLPDSVTSMVDSAFGGCSGLISITFGGTADQWNAISKGSNWNSNAPATKVICSDGEVDI